MYGLYDTNDHCWMGNDEGPLLYEDEMLAKVAARMVDVQLKQAPGRTRAVPYNEESVVHKDEKETAMGPEEALRRLEEGLVI
jgi:hypothetical protein